MCVSTLLSASKHRGRHTYSNKIWREERKLAKSTSAVPNTSFFPSPFTCRIQHDMGSWIDWSFFYDDHIGAGYDPVTKKFSKSERIGLFNNEILLGLLIAWQSQLVWGLRLKWPFVSGSGSFYLQNLSLLVSWYILIPRKMLQASRLLLLSIFF